MLGVRTAEGIALDNLPVVADGEGREAASGVRVEALVTDGLIDGSEAAKGRVILTLRGRLLADYVTRELMGY